jgi:cysteine desulfurase
MEKWSSSMSSSSPVTGAMAFAAAVVLVSFGIIHREECAKERKQDGSAANGIDEASAAAALFEPNAWKLRLDKKFNSCVYLDYNASTPVFPEVGQAMLPFITSCFGNPSSGHAYARPCREAVYEARRNVAKLIGAQDPDETIIFTSCGSESDNWAIDIALHHYRTTDPSKANAVPRFIASSVEHPAIMAYLKVLESRGALELVVVGVDSQGFLNLQELCNSLTIHTALVTIMHSNNEIGTLQPIRDISRIVEAYNSMHQGANILLHVDAAQSIGKVPVTVAGVDMMSVVGHKFGAPKGIAVLYVKNGIRFIFISSGANIPIF